MKIVTAFLMTLFFVQKSQAAQVECQAQAEKLVKVILQSERPGEHIGVEIKASSSENSDPAGIVSTFDIQGIRLNAKGQKVGDLAQTFSRIVLTPNGKSCTVVSYSLPLAN